MKLQERLRAQARWTPVKRWVGRNAEVSKIIPKLEDEAADALDAQEARIKTLEEALDSACAYDAGEGVCIEAREQIGGGRMWAVSRLGYVLGRTLDWEHEPLPSGRDKSFLERCRFASPSEAHDFLTRARAAMEGK